MIKSTTKGAGSSLQLPASSLVLGVIGHVDHGKSALVKALSGQETDRLQEEKRRGISIALGFAQVQLDSKLRVDLIDMPGHERFVRTMIAGATGIDAVLLVVAANEGIKPQTVEHIEIAGLLGLAGGVLVVSKGDLATAADADRVARRARRLMLQSGIEAVASVVTSAREGTGLHELRAALKSLSRRQTHRPMDGVTYLPIDRAFSIAGHGPVVTGTLRGSSIDAAHELELLPAGRALRVRALQVHGAKVPYAMPGQRVAVNLRDIDVKELAKGMVLAAPGALSPSRWLTVSLRALPGAGPLKNGIGLRVLFGTQEQDVRLRLLDRDVLEAGDSAFAQLHCAQPAALPAGECVILRISSPPRTVAGGQLLDAEDRRAQRRNARLLERLQQLRSLPPAAIVMAEIERAGVGGAKLQDLSRVSGLGVARIIELLRTAPCVVTRSETVLLETHMNAVLARIPVLLAGPEGRTAQQLRQAIGAGVEVLDEALAALLARGLIVKQGVLYGMPRPLEDRARAQDEAALAARIAETLRRAGLSPPKPGEIITDVRSKRAVERLLRNGLIVRALDVDKGKEIFFHRDAITEAQRRLEPMLQRPPGMLVTEIGALLGISRKFTMPLLGHLDTIKFTRRIKDRRVRA